jgi:hypothetical protein
VRTGGRVPRALRAEHAWSRPLACAPVRPCSVRCAPALPSSPRLSAWVGPLSLALRAAAGLIRWTRGVRGGSLLLPLHACKL